MKILIAIIVLCFASTNLVARQGDSVSSAPNSSDTKEVTSSMATTDPYEGTDDFSPGMAFIVVIAAVFVLACVGAGIALTVIGLLLLFALISFGILSASVLVGLNKKSFALGFKTFLISSSTVGGFILFALAFWGLNEVMHWWTDGAALTLGASLGLVVGLSFGFIAFYVLRRLTTFLSKRLNEFLLRSNG